MALSFVKDIRPLIRDGDVDCMKVYGIELDQLSSVRMNAALIYERLSEKSMPQDGPWSDADIAKFKEWMDEGMQE